MTTLNPTQDKFLPYILAFALFMQILDATILNTALPSMAEALAVPALSMQWTIISYALALALFIPASGFLADYYGSQRIFLFAIVLFSFGSLLCALSSSLNQLIAARVVQGIGGAMMTPVARLVLVKSYPRGRLLTVMNFAVIPALVAPVIGPLLGGYIVELFTWHWIFLINLPIGIAGFYFGLQLMPNIKEPKKPFDWLGFLLFAGAACCLTIAIECLSHDKKIMQAVMLSSSGLALLTLYYFNAKKSRHPLFPLRLFEERTFRIGIIGNIFTRLGISAIPFLLPLLLQLAFGYSPSLSGWMVAPLAIGAMAIKPLVSPIIKRTSYRSTLLFNTFIMAGFLLLLSTITTETPWWAITTVLFFVGACNSMQFSAINTITIGDLSKELTSSGNSLMAVNQQLALGMGITLGAALLNIFSLQQANDNLFMAFQYTFCSLAIITFLAGLYFLKLAPSDGEGLY